MIVLIFELLCLVFSVVVVMVEVIGVFDYVSIVVFDFRIICVLLFYGVE